MFMCILWWKDRDKLNFFHIGLSVLLGTFMSPHLHLHGLSFLIIPLLSISIALYSKHRNLSIFLTPLISFSLFVTEFVFPALRYGVSYIVFAFLAVGLFILYRSQS